LLVILYKYTPVRRLLYSWIESVNTTTYSFTFSYAFFLLGKTARKMWETFYIGCIFVHRCCTLLTNCRGHCCNLSMSTKQFFSYLKNRVRKRGKPVPQSLKTLRTSSTGLSLRNRLHKSHKFQVSNLLRRSFRLRTNGGMRNGI